MIQSKGSRLAFFVLLFFFIPAVSDAGSDIRLIAGASYNSLSGEFDLKPGMGMNLGAGFPYSRNLEFFAQFNLPLSYEVDDPQGQIFSAGPYYREYDRLSCYSLSAGFNLLGIFRDNQKLIPLGGLKFGKTWLGGSSKDVFSGINTDFAGGLRYRFNERLTAQLLYNYSGINFDRLKIGGDSEDITGNVVERINTISVSVIYHIFLSRNNELAFSHGKVD